MGDWLTTDRILTIVTAVTILIVGMLLARFASRALGRLGDKRSAQTGHVARRVGFYGLSVLVVLATLSQFGVDLSVLLGAAGVLTVAIGIASQTSASNLVAGLFLMGERPFVIGDIIEVGTTIGTVASVDLMSVKLTTFDNILVRIPNEKILKSEIRNISHYPARRFDMVLKVGHEVEVERVRDLLYEVARTNPLCLEEPRPLFLVLSISELGVELRFSPWAARERFAEMRTSFQMDALRALKKAGVEIPYPRRVLHSPDPIPVQLTEPRGTG